MWSVYDYIQANGVEDSSRNGPVITVPHPVTICYTHPQEQVNYCPVRDANPFFHFAERLWFLEAEGDTEFICRFLPRMMEYSDDGKYFNAQYGHNIRQYFGFDQLEKVSAELQEDRKTRQAVVQIWNPNDLSKETKDKACNMILVFRVVGSRLDMTVFNRSNDAIWGGVSGANISNLFVFQEYVAALANLQIGKQYIVSNNLHVYADNPKLGPLMSKYSGHSVEYVKTQIHGELYTQGVIGYQPMITHVEEFDEELFKFMEDVRENNIPSPQGYKNEWFDNVAVPLLTAFCYNKLFKKDDALKTAQTIQASDWRYACEQWINRRIE